MTKVVPLPPSFTPPTAETSAYIAILFAQEPPTTDQLVRAAQSAGLPGDSVQTDGRSALGASAGEVTVAATGMPPQPDLDLAAAARWSYNWPEAAQVAQHYGSLVLLQADSHSPDTFTLAGTAMAYAAAIATLPGALAVYTASSQVLSRPEEYRGILPSVYDGQVPTTHWFSTRLAEHNGATLVYTQGLEAFGSLDFELYGAEADLGEQHRILQSVLFDTVARLRENPHDFPKPGDVFDVDGVGRLEIAGVTQGHHADAGSDEFAYQLRYRNDARLDALLDEPVAPEAPAQAAPYGQPQSGATAYPGPGAQPSAPQPQYQPSAPQPQYQPSAPQPQYQPSAPQPQYQPSAPQPAGQPQYQPSAAPIAAEESSPSYPSRGLVLLAGPIDLTQVAQELSQAGVSVSRVEGPVLEATAGAFRMTLTGRPGIVPDDVWTVQPPQSVCLGNVPAQQAAHAFLEVGALDGGLGTQRQQDQLRQLVLSSVARRPQALAVVHEQDENATPPQAYVQNAR